MEDKARELSHTDWIVLLVLSGLVEALLLGRLWVTGAALFNLYVILASLTEAFILATYAMAYGARDFAVHVRLRLDEALYQRTERAQLQYKRLEAETQAGAEQNRQLQERNQELEKENFELKWRNAQIQDESAMQAEVERYKSLYRNKENECRDKELELIELRRRRVSGQGLAEYGVVLLLITIVVVGILGLIGAFPPAVFSQVATGLQP